MATENTEYTDCVVVLTTLPVEADAAAFARGLVDARVAACVNILPPMESVYRWQGKVEQAPERQLVIKTARGVVRQLEARVRELHPYEVPELLVLPVADGGDAYLRWIAESTA